MKKVLRFRITDKYIFDAVKNGSKTVETRAGTTKFKDIKKGDALVFICGREKFEKEVKKVSHFNSVDDMIKAIDFKKIMPFVSSAEELRNTYNGFPGYGEKIKKFGLITLEIA